MRQNINSRVPLFTLALVLAAAGLGGCYPADQAPGADGAADAPAADWTTYAGLHIYAERWKIKTVEQTVKEHDDFGPVDLLEFENAIVSRCYETIRYSEAERYRHICDQVNIDEYGPPAPASVCQYRFVGNRSRYAAGTRT